MPSPKSSRDPAPDCGDCPLEAAAGILDQPIGQSATSAVAAQSTSDQASTSERIRRPRELPELQELGLHPRVELVGCLSRQAGALDQLLDIDQVLCAVGRDHARRQLQLDISGHREQREALATDSGRGRIGATRGGTSWPLEPSNRGSSPRSRTKCARLPAMYELLDIFTRQPRAFGRLGGMEMSHGKSTSVPSSPVRSS